MPAEQLSKGLRLAGYPELAESLTVAANKKRLEDFGVLSTGAQAKSVGGLVAQAD